MEKKFKPKTKENSLSEKETLLFADEDWKRLEDVKEKVQNAQRRIKEEFIRKFELSKLSNKEYFEFLTILIDKIFKEEFGGKLK